MKGMHSYYLQIRNTFMILMWLSCTAQFPSKAFKLHYVLWQKCLLADLHQVSVKNLQKHMPSCSTEVSKRFLGWPLRTRILHCKLVLLFYNQKREKLELSCRTWNWLYSSCIKSESILRTKPTTSSSLSWLI